MARHSSDEQQPLIANEEYSSTPQSTTDYVHTTSVPTPFKPVFYHRRWYILAVFCLMASAQCYNWNTWGPIADSAKVVFNWKNSMISLLAAWGPVMFMLSIFPLSWLMETKGLRLVCVLTSLFVAVGTGARCISLKPPLSTWLINVGQIGVSLAGPVSMAGATVLSARWFPPAQRVTATAIASRVMSFGGGLPYIIGPAVVSDINATDSTHVNQTSVDEVRSEIRILMFAQFGWGAGIFLLILLHFPSLPPSPPSIAVHERTVGFQDGLKLLLRMRNFWLLGVPYSMTYGLYIGWAACLTINLQPFGISQKEAGYLGFFGVLSGAVTGILMARLVDLLSGRTKPALIVMYVTACGSTLWFTLVCEHIAPYSRASLYSSRIISATCLSAMVPLVFETLCETTYPTPESVTNATLTLLKNFWVLVFLAVVWVPGVATRWMNWLLVGATGFCVPIVTLFKERHHRLDRDTAVNSDPSTNRPTDNSAVVT